MANLEPDQEFVEYIVKNIVDNPDDVKTERKIDEMGVLISLTVNPADMGKVIGKEGRTAKAVRTLLRVLGARHNSRVNMKILEPGGREVPVGSDGEEPKGRPVRSGGRGRRSESPRSEAPRREEPKAEEEKATEIL
jgi:predicted RNA-binding protein YlqC (UPF0109 family)